ncbi:flavin-binding monooxygenase-like protein-like protein [Bisporella sp. PMI_857]|nr:flavin-binding monooxygenase-like protein-like protein [Bisporella sp. PMI_857]
MNSEVKHDAIVIGAGISGIYAAKFYLDIHPNSRLVILDRDNCVGGTWNSRRGYDSFWTQLTVGMAEFPDISMPRPSDEDLYYEFFKAKHTTKYLESYVDHQIYGGRTLRDRIILSTEVRSVFKVDGEWVITALSTLDQTESTFHAPKLFVASGLTSIANMPDFLGQEVFNGPIIHQEDFGSSNVLSSTEVQNITVLGAGKSSGDMAYSAVKAGKTVNWVVKESDTTGPSFFLSPKGKGPYKNAFEIGMTRAAATLALSYLNGDSWWKRFLHSSSLGVKLMTSFWKKIDDEARTEADFEGRTSKNNFSKLAPHSPLFWQNGTGALLNQKDFYDTVAEHIKVHCGDISHLEEGQVCLKTGVKIPSDTILCGTGWVRSLQFFTPEQNALLGLPHPPKDETPSEKANWTRLETAANEEVLTSFPILANPPPHYQRPRTLTPYRLYKNIVPISDSSDHSIAFIGHVVAVNYFSVVQCQSMWATAYFDGQLDIPSKQEQEREVALFTTWCGRRYLSMGMEGNNMTFDLLGYTDGLLEQLGLKSHLRGWFKDSFAPVWASDYGRLVDEYIGKYGKDEAKSA